MSQEPPSPCVGEESLVSQKPLTPELRDNWNENIDGIPYTQEKVFENLFLKSFSITLS